MSSRRRATVRRLLWTRRAEVDLERIGDYIAADDPIAAERWVQKLMDQARKVLDAPLGGRVVPEFRLNDIRETFLRTYRIVYRVRDDTVTVLTVFEGHRRLPASLDIDDMP
ncbi:MAG: type II toxin-antitoxin system RelE/ParE family toxin [Byssovorax sp.]